MRYDLAIESPEYVRELAQHHVGGYLKIAPEHLREGPLSMMMKPGMGTYDRFKELFDRYSKRGRQGAVPDPVLHRRASRHHATRTCWSSRSGSSSNGFRADQVQAFLPSPMATATAMYHSGRIRCERITPHQRTGDRAEGAARAPAA